jgi:beta-glucosidase
MRLSAMKILDSDTLTIMIDVENTGKVDAKEIVQIYVQPPKSVLYKAQKELKGFAKIALKKGETGTVTIKLNKRSFAYYNTNICDWHVESGTYTILAASSTRDIRLTAEVKITSSAPDTAVPDYQTAAPAYYQLQQEGIDVSQASFEAVYGAKMRVIQPVVKGCFDMNSSIAEVNHGFAGKIFVHIVSRKFMLMNSKESREDQTRMVKAMFNDLPLRTLVSFSNGTFTFASLDGLLLIMNGHWLKGLWALLTKRN